MSLPAGCCVKLESALMLTSSVLSSSQDETLMRLLSDGMYVPGHCVLAESVETLQGSRGKTVGVCGQHKVDSRRQSELYSQRSGPWKRFMYNAALLKQDQVDCPK